MRLRVVLLVLTMLFGFASSAIAATGNNVQFNSYYMSGRNEYRVDYWSYPGGTTQLRLKFAYPDGQIFERTFGSSALSGIFMLTCSGVYELYFEDSSGGVLGSIVGLDTPQIVNGSCSSYSEGGAKNDLSATSTPNGDGTYNVDWNDAGTSYEVWESGSLVDTLTSSGAAALPPGSYTIIAKDGSGNVVGESDILLPATGGSGGETPGGCEVCDKLTELLACPGWDELLGDLNDIIPDAPDWDSVADKIGASTVSHLSEYLGPVPAAPTQTEIDTATPLPELDTTVEGAEQLEPEVPAGYEQPIPFDVESGPEIEVVDESEPFVINDPLHNVPHDAPGVPVLPGDERNDSNGIKTPESPIPVYVGVESPTPTGEAGEPPVPTPPDGEAPPDDPTPTPGDVGGVIPIPAPYQP